MFDINTTTTGGFGLSGAPLNRVGNYSCEVGGPSSRIALWFWGGADYQDINAGVVNFFKIDPRVAGPVYLRSSRGRSRSAWPTTRRTIQDFNGKATTSSTPANKFQFLYQTNYKVRNNRGANSTTAPEATTSQYSAGPWQRYEPDLPGDAHVPAERQARVHQSVHVRGRRLLPGQP